MAHFITSERALKQHVEATARKTTNNPASALVARVGYVAKGTVYLIMGGLAVKAATGEGGRLTDTRGAIGTVAAQPFGQFLLAIVAAGLFGYALWCIVRALFDADGLGHTAKAVVMRIGYGVVGLSYLALAFGALQLALHTGSGGKSTDANAKDWTAQLLAHAYGPPLVALGGLILLGVALALAFQDLSGQFLTSFKQAELRDGPRKMVRALGACGLAALGVVLAIVGVFLVVAAYHRDAKQAKGLGGALVTLEHQSYGALLLALVAIGLVAYGLYSFAQARYRRVGAQ